MIASKRTVPSVRLVAALALAAAGTLATAVSTGVATKAASERLEAQIGGEVAAAATFMAGELDRGMFARWRDVQVLASLDQVRRADEAPASRRRVLDELKKTMPDYAWLGITDADGRVVAATGGVLEGQDVSARPWYRAALGGPAVQDVHDARLLAPYLGQARDGGPPRLVDIAAPLSDPGRAGAGVVAAHLHWDWATGVEATLRDALPRTVADAEVLVVASNGKVLLGPSALRGSTVSLPSRRSGPGWRIEEDRSGPLFVGTAATRGYRSYPGLGWTVVIRRGADAALAPVNELRQELLLRGAALTLALAMLAWWAAGALTKSLARLARAAAAVGAGARPEVVASGPREVREVGRALGDAASELLHRSAALRESEARLRNVLDTKAVGVVFFDLTGGIEDANDAFLAMIGHTRDELESGAVRYEFLTPPDWAWRDEQTVAELKATGQCVPFEKEYFRRDGSRFWILCASKMLDERTAVEFVIDVTARRAVEEREHLLAREVDHRAKNMLAVVQSIVQLARAEDVASLKTAVNGRIRSLARTHSLLAASRWEGVALSALVTEELAPFAPKGAVQIAGPPLRLRPAGAQALALVIHELAINAVKHGALSVEGGHLGISWTLAAAGDEQRLEFQWTERDGPTVSPPAHKGFGSVLVRSTVERQLKGAVAVDWRLGGLVCTLTVPAEGLVAPAAPPADQVSRVPDSTSQSAKAGDPAPLAGARILVVEDEPVIGMQVEAVLAHAGYEIVGPASGVAEALALVATAAPTAAVLDVNLGSERSYPIADVLAAKCIPFVFCTGYAGATELPSRFDGTPVLPKPLDEGELVRAVTRMAAVTERV